jgi:hypothetical protein
MQLSPLCIENKVQISMTRFLGLFQNGGFGVFLNKFV